MNLHFEKTSSQNFPYRFQAVLLDLDGTLLDTEEAINSSMKHAFTFAGLDPDDENIKKLAYLVMSRGASLGQAVMEIGPAIKVSDDVNPLEVVEEYRNHYAKVSKACTKPFAGVEESLKKLNELGTQLCVVTNKGEKDARSALTEYELIDYFSHIITDREGITPKPDPQSYNEVLAPLLKNPDPSRVLMVGDTATDINYAHNAGIQACWAKYGFGDAEFSLQSKPEFVANTAFEWGELGEQLL